MEIGLIISALGLGFASGFHCVGMCGPIALSLGLTREKALSFYLQNLIYQLGRVVTYTFLGAVFGIVGEGLNLAGLQSFLTVFSGIMLIVMAFLSMGNSDFASKIPFLQKIFLNIKIGLAKFIQKSSYSSRFITGILNGFLPCGMVYMALTSSLAYGGVKEGAVFMLLFGLGTLPLMFVIVFLGDLFTQALRLKILKIIPYIMAVLGFIFILRGLPLDIPYVSPKKEVLKIQHIKKGEKMESCH